MSRTTTSAVIERHIRGDVRAMHAYAVQPSDGLVKLDAMENPFRLPEPLRAALGARLAEVAINRYPGSRNDDLRRALAQHAGLPEGFDLILGNGSDELISMLSLACATPGARTSPTGAYSTRCQRRRRRRTNRCRWSATCGSGRSRPTHPTPASGRCRERSGGADP